MTPIVCLCDTTFKKFIDKVLVVVAKSRQSRRRPLDFETQGKIAIGKVREFVASVTRSCWVIWSRYDPPWSVAGKVIR